MATKYERLQAYAHAWFATAQQNSIIAALYRKKGYGKLADLWQEEAEDEFKEAQEVNKRLIDLGITPTFGTDQLAIYDDPKEYLEAFVKEAPAGIAELNQLIHEFEDDYVTRKMLEDFVVDEEEHLNWVKQHLAVIEAIGYDNYLIEQLDI